MGCFAALSMTKGAYSGGGRPVILSREAKNPMAALYGVDCMT